MQKEIRTAKDLNNNLIKLLLDLEEDKVGFAKASAIAKIADKINSNNSNRLRYKKLTMNNDSIDFFEEK